MTSPRHFTELSDVGADGLKKLLDSSDKGLERRRRGSRELPLGGRSIALLFEKASTRTRLSLEIAVNELGGHPLVLTSSGSQMGRGEPIKDTARVLSRMVRAITFRTSTAARLQEMVEHSTVPVLNALTDESHPLQVLADLQTVRRVRGRLEGLRYTWVGDGNNMANSWIEAAGLLKLELRLACPQGYEPAQALIERARALGADIQVCSDPSSALRGADVISTDVFTSMGQEEQSAKRLRDFAGFRVTSALVATASPEVVVLHCLPAHRGEEIDDDVLEGPRSFIFDQAEARLHTAKAALLWALDLDD